LLCPRSNTIYGEIVSRCGEGEAKDLPHLNQTTSISLYSGLIIHSVTVILCIFLFSCGTLREIPEAGNVHLIEKVPFFSQEDYQCGPASLAMILNYWGIRVPPGDIAKEIFSDSAGGTLNIDMVLYAQGKGLFAFQFKATIDELRKYIDSGYPVIVLVDYGFSLYRVNHFMVVTGYNEQGIIVNSGRNKDKFIAEKDFLKTWGRADFWTLLIKPN
jgi:hypothetical protein